MLKPVGFWSYAREDDKDVGGQLSTLRQILANTINLRLGGEVKLFQDSEAIPFGADWASSIAKAIQDVSFFIPIVTPRFLQSKNCHHEFVSFQSKMVALQRDDLIFPVHYVDVGQTKSDETAFGEAFSALHRHQWIDFRPLQQLHDIQSQQVRQWAGGLAGAIVDAIRKEAIDREYKKHEGSGPTGPSSPHRQSAVDDPNPMFLSELNLTHDEFSIRPQSVASMSGEQDVRIAVSALLKITNGDRYALIRNLHRPEAFGPIGGVFKYTYDARAQLDSFEFRPQVSDFEMGSDLRGILPLKYVSSFMKWFVSGEGRETAQECVRRELEEELAEVGQNLKINLRDVSLSRVRAVYEGPDTVPGESYIQLRRFEIYEFETSLTKAKTLLKDVTECVSRTTEVIWPTSKEIIRGRNQLGRIIGSHAPYLFGGRRYRSPDPAF